MAGKEHAIEKILEPKNPTNLPPFLTCAVVKAIASDFAICEHKDENSTLGGTKCQSFRSIDRFLMRSAPCCLDQSK